MRTRKVIFLLFLFTCIIFGMSFVSAENNSTLDDDNINYQNNVIGVNHDDSINDEDICADSNSNNQINKNKSFSDLNTVINGDLNKKEIILYDDYSYQEGDEEFSQGIYINRSVTIDGQGHLLYFDKPSYVFHINADNVIRMSSMFDNCYNITDINFSNFTTKELMYTENMFYDCNSLANIDLSSFDTCKIDNMSRMFINCHNLKTVNLLNFQSNQNTFCNDIFKNCK